MKRKTVNKEEIILRVCDTCGMVYDGTTAKSGDVCRIWNCKGTILDR